MKAASGTPLICIAGGIGSGKSVVSRVLVALGYAVYDCDSRAKILMDSREDVKCALADEIGPEVVCNGIIDRRRLADIVFSNPDRLAALNRIVHSAVVDDLVCWHRGLDVNPDIPCFVETALPFESGIDRIVDAMWVVDAPVETRVRRVMRRNGIKREQVLARISSQRDFSAVAQSEALPVSVIVNDDIHAVLPQIMTLLEKLRLHSVNK